MLAIVSLLLIVTLSLVVTRVATIALIHTGLSREVARFQARSAFSGVGYTTSETERIVSHPVRRRIVMWLMLLGNAGFVTFIATFILGFVSDTNGTNVLLKIGMLFGGLAAIWAISVSKTVDRRLSFFIDKMLRKYTDIEVRDFASLLHLAGEYRISELLVEEGDWIAGLTLRESRLRDEGVAVLGVNRADGSFIGTPNGETCIKGDDLLILYGRTSALRRLDTRAKAPQAEREHEQAVKEQAEIEQVEHFLDEETGDGTSGESR